MKSLKILALAICIFTALQSNAQKGEVKINLQYTYAMPVGDFKNNVISNNSPRGVSGDILYNVSNKFSVGLGLGYQDFYQKYPRALYQTNHNETTSAVLSNSIQIMPVLAKAAYYPLGNKKFPVQPYINAGAGFGIISFSQYLGEFGGTDNSAGLMLQGGAGINISLNHSGSAGIKLGGDYNMVSYNRNGFNNFNNLAFNAGVFFPIH